MRASADFEPLPEQARLRAFFQWRYGIDPSVFEGHVFIGRPNTRSVWIAARSCAPPPGLRPASMGIQVMRKPPPRGKPSSVFLQRFGGQASRNVYVLGEEGAARFMRRESQRIAPIDDAQGYCVVRTERRVLGCGRIEGETLHSEIPKAWLVDTRR